MIHFDNIAITGFEPAIRGMRNPMNSWDRSDSGHCRYGTTAYHDDSVDWVVTCNNGTCAMLSCPSRDKESERLAPQDDCGYVIGPEDLALAKKLASLGSVHAKYRRMMNVYIDITAPLYWWKEFDTYKIGTVSNSCSTMHKIHTRDLTLEDFSCEDLPESTGKLENDIFTAIEVGGNTCMYSPKGLMQMTVDALNHYRKMYKETKDKKWWRMMIQTLPSSYNQTRTVMLNYEVLSNIYKTRKDHKLSEWREFCRWISCLPYAELITNCSKEEQHD